MSFGSETGRSRSGSKNFSNREKKLKRKKQEYHVHRRGHAQEEKAPDPEEVRARTILALDRLGHQVLSTEGGYDLSDWLRSLESLLDDFQERVGPSSITDQFLAGREEALKLVSGAPSDRGADPAVEEALRDEEEARATLGDLEKRAVARLASLREDRDSCARDLKLEKGRLAEIQEARKSRKFFSRLIGSGPSTVEAEVRVAALQTKLETLEGDIERSRKARSSMGDAADEEARRDAEQRLEAARGRLASLQEDRRDAIQVARERELATKKLAEVISSMRLRGAATAATAADESQP